METLQLKTWLVKQCSAMGKLKIFSKYCQFLKLDSLGITKPTPIQENCIPRILEGKDCVGCARTGSGKTLV
jgi:superfamily II DNA/RNA helicase